MMALRAGQMYKAGVGASSSLVMLPEQPSLLEVDSSSGEEDQRGLLKSHRRPTSPPPSSYPRGSPMARSSSQKRITQELNLGGSSLAATPRGLRTPTTAASPSIMTPTDDYRFPSTSTPTHQIPTRRHSSRTSATNTSSSISTAPTTNTRDYFGSDFSSVTAAASDSTRVPFPSGYSTSSQSTATNHTAAAAAAAATGYFDSPSAKRIARHVSLTGGAATMSVDSINLIPASPPKNTSPIAIPARPAYRHLRYSSELHLGRNQGGGVAASASDVALQERLPPRVDSEIGSLYTNTLGSFTTEDVSAYSALRTPRESSHSAVAPSKHKLVVVEDGKPNVTYQMGNCIGRGQFGSVYRALNLNTGQMVAVKRIKIEGLAENEVTQLMGEVDLLKSLSHPSVVKYEGLVRGSEVVSIILEYVENGSLLHTLKAFGNFPEKLVASYVVKILEGLNYLHDMKVVHCDLKAANILTTKNGNVKLSDFGVSLNLQAVKNIKNDAIGTPNWMAPEVIELKGASTAADIWSLGCTIIELLTSKPPYGDMLAMSALWRIVEDDCPPFPEKISEPLRDFLTLCFHKDPTMRPSADRLFEHEWLRKSWHSHLALRPQDSVPFLRRISDVRANRLSILTRDRLGSTETSQSQMERSSSSPPASLSLRPHLVSMRAASAPHAWTMQENALEDAGLAGMSSEQASPLTPSVFPIMSSPTPMSVVDLTLRRGSDPTSGSFDLLRSASSLGAEKGPNGVVTASESSHFDLKATDVYSLDDSNKQHAFVKITFAKAAVCRICREGVKKHAVLCEECGLICHASCTKKSIAPCNLRAQLLMYAAQSASRASADHFRGSSPHLHSPRGLGVVSPPPLSSSHAAPPTPTSPRLFKIPFARARKTSNIPIDILGTPTATTTLVVPTTPTTPLPASPLGCETPTSPVRKRRFSLRPYMTRRPSPVQMEEVSMSRSLSSPRSMSGDAGRTDSLEYGSSISSLCSSIPGGATSLTKMDTSISISGSPLPPGHDRKSTAPARHRHSVNITAAVTSPQLLSMEKEKEAARKAKRRQSATPQRVTTQMDMGFPAMQSPNLPSSSNNNSISNNGPAKASSKSNNLSSPSKRSHLPSSKHDCIVM